MKITRKKNKKLITILSILAIIILCIGGYFAYKYFYSLTPEEPKPTSALDEPKRSATDKKQAAALKSDPGQKTTTSHSDKPDAPVKSDTSDSRKIVQVTAATNKDSTTVFIRGGVNYPVRDGQCTATLTGPGGNTITRLTEILPGPASADCKTIQIPLSELSAGKWSFTLNYSSAEFTGKSESVAFNV